MRMLMFRKAKDTANKLGTKTQAPASCLHTGLISSMFPIITLPLWDVLLGSHINIAPAQSPYHSWRILIISYPHATNPIWASPATGNSLSTARATKSLSPHPCQCLFFQGSRLILDPAMVSFLLQMGRRERKKKGGGAGPLRDVESFSALLSLKPAVLLLLEITTSLAISTCNLQAQSDHTLIS